VLFSFIYMIGNRVSNSTCKKTEAEDDAVPSVLYQRLHNSFAGSKSVIEKLRRIGSGRASEWFGRV
jgi:hypothetical protein